MELPATVYRTVIYVRCRLFIVAFEIMLVRVVKLTVASVVKYFFSFLVNPFCFRMTIYLYIQVNPCAEIARTIV